MLANLPENHYFIKGSVGADRERLVFVASFHHVGRELSGIMEAAAFSILEPHEDSEDRDPVKESFSVCPSSPFYSRFKRKPRKSRMRLTAGSTPPLLLG
jgi:hypothetical protein